MRYGYFDDAEKEYVIERPDTPRSWSNYLGSTRFGSIITNNAGGYHFFRSAAEGRFTRLRFNAVPMDQPGRYLYIRDNGSGDFWSSSWQPVGKPLDLYKSECRHGTGYTVITSEYSGLETEVVYTVPVERDFELWIVKITNTGNAERDLSMFTYVEYASNWSTRQDLVNLQYSAYTVKTELVDGMIRHSVIDNVPSNPDEFKNNDQGRWSFMGIVGTEPSGWEGDRERFLGPYRTYADPLTVEHGKCSNTGAYGDNACGTFQIDRKLGSGETAEFMVVMGVGKAEKEGKAALAEYSTVEKGREALEGVKKYWWGQMGRLTCKTPDKEFNSMINVWNAYNALINFRWSRAASLVYNGERDGYGYRDTVQDCTGSAAIIPEQVGGRLELMISGQTSCGGAKPLVQPFAHTPGEEAGEYGFRSDDCLWLFNSVPAYVKETGDMDFYEKVIPYCDKGEATVLGHLKRAMEFNFDHLGDHGLPCGLVADWNDCIEFGPKGESVFVAFQLRYALQVYIDICSRLGKQGEVKWAEEKLVFLDEKLDGFVWDGEWYRRGTREDGSIIGTKDDQEGTIFHNPQSWSVISGYGNEERKKQAMDMVYEKLSTDYGIMVCNPGFEKTDYHVVRAVLISPGQKENGGIFSHPQGWGVMAECILGRGDRAYEYFRNYMPAAQNDQADKRQIEPYVHCQSTHSPLSPKYGVSRIPWLSGTACWSYYAGTNYILGIRAEYDGLLIDPCLPSDWTEIKVTRVFRDRAFDITIRSGEKGKGVKSMTLNGKAVEGNLILLENTKDENTVEVNLL